MTSGRGVSRSSTFASEDADMIDIDPPNKKFYIAVNYGATCSAVSFVKVAPDEDPESQPR